MRDGILNTTRRYDGDNFALQSAVDDAHAIIKKAAKKSGVDHASFLSALTDRYFQEQKDNGDGDEDGDESEQSADASDSSAGDEGDGDAANPGGDAGKLRSLQSRKPGTMHLKPLKETDEEDLKLEDTSNRPPRKRVYQREPSPIDKNPINDDNRMFPKGSPTLAQQHRALHGRATMVIPNGHGERLLLNVTPSEYAAAKAKR